MKTHLLFLFILLASTATRPAALAAPRADDGGVIDVLVVYTQNARAIAGGTDAQAVEMIQDAVDGVNNSFVLNGVLTQLNVVAYQPVFYLEQVNEDFHADLNNLTGAADGYLDEIHALRDYYAADVVLMVTGTWFYIYTGDSHLTAAPDASLGFAVWEARGLDDAGGIYPSQWIARLLGVDDAPPFDIPDIATMNANRVAVANYRESVAPVPVVLTLNGSFEFDMDEDGVPDFWKAAGWAKGDRRLCGKPKVHSGECSVTLKLGQGGNALIQNVVGSQPGLNGDLVLSGYALGKPAACVKATLVVVYSVLPKEKVVATDCDLSLNSWSAFAVVTSVAGAVDKIKAKVKGSGGGKLWFDDVEVVASPADGRRGGR